MKTIEITTATTSQVADLVALYRRCGADMWENGYDNWGDFYPSIETIETDIALQSLFVLKQGSKIIGVVALDENQPPMYHDVSWEYKSEKVLVVHRLAIDVFFQGQGFAKMLMHFAEKFALSNGYDVIRLDAYSINPPLLQFYTKLGYQITKETISLGDRWKHPFHCFEKRIINE